MTRRIDWFFWIVFIILVALLCAVGIDQLCGCESDTTGPAPDPDVTNGGGELPLCTGAKTDSPENCRLPDAGVVDPDDTGSPDPDQGTEVSPDTTIPPPDQGTPEPCPPPDLPGNGAECPRGHGCHLQWSTSPPCAATCEGFFGENWDNPLSPEEVRVGCGFGNPPA